MTFESKDGYDEEGIIRSKKVFYICENEFTKEEEDEFIKLANAKNLKKIEGYIKFFVVLMIISLIVAFILGIINGTGSVK